MSGNSQKGDVRRHIEGAATRRKTWFLPGGLYCFEDEFDSEQPVTARILTCRAWLLEVYKLDRGELYFLRGGVEQVRANSARVGAFFPPFTISRLCFRAAKGRVFGVAGTDRLPPECARRPIVFETTFREIRSDAEVQQALRSARNAQDVDTNPAASALSRRAKRLIDQSYLTGTRISAVAAQLRVTPEHLARQFRRDFEMSPRDYLHQLRIADAPLKLAIGEQIASISHDVGYNDLSRFYKQFRKATRTSPGACKTILAARPDKRRAL